MPNYEQVNWERAACAGVHTDLFFDVEEERNTDAYQYINAVRSMCARCEIQFDCLSYAFAHEEFGVWGGLTSPERASFTSPRKYSNQRKRGLKSMLLHGITLQRLREAYEHSRNDGSVAHQSANYRENGVISYRRPRE